MSEECALTFPVITPNGQKNSDTFDTQTSDETSNSYQERFKIGQQVQFLKITLQKNKKISYKETFGTITYMSDGFAEIEDSMGDIVRCNLSNVKKSDRTIFSRSSLNYLNVI